MTKSCVCDYKVGEKVYKLLINVYNNSNVELKYKKLSNYIPFIVTCKAS
jgi:hypothetical protein